MEELTARLIRAFVGVRTEVVALTLEEVLREALDTNLLLMDLVAVAV